MPSSRGPQGQRTRSTRSRVHVTDALAGGVITFGGMGVIAAVLGICVYLAASVLPLFEPGRVGEARASATAALTEPLILAAVDEYERALVTLDAGGVLRAADLSSGTPTGDAVPVREGRRPTAWSWSEYDGVLALGYDDGSLQLGTLGFDAEQLRRDQVPPEVAGLAVGSSAPMPGGGAPGAVIERLGPDQFRVITPRLQLRDGEPLAEGSGAIVRLDSRTSGGNELVVVARADGSAALVRVSTIRPLGGGKPRTRLESSPVALAPPPGKGLPDRLAIAADGSGVVAMWSDGTAQRYAVGAEDDGAAIALTETVSLLPPGRRATSWGTMIGGLTFLVGDDAGTLHAAFIARDPARGAADGLSLRVAHRLRVSDRPLVLLTSSHRNRSVLAADDAGALSIWNVTAHKRVASIPPSAAGAPAAVMLSPKFDGLVALSASGGATRWPLDPGHAEASWRSLFGAVHYEGQAAPSYVYQSTAATDSAEPKLSLRPLIHGTLKATVFAMLFAVPLAVLAAIYTSEFMSPRTRNVVKPAVEMMASLPSVVLGFIAAIVVAPFVARVVPAVILGLILVPLVLLVGAHLWQMLPAQAAARYARGVRTSAIGVAVLLGLAVTAALAPVAERALFRPTRGDALVQAGLTEPVPREAWPAWVGSRAFMSPDDERALRASGLYFRAGAVVRPVEPATPEQRASLEAALTTGELSRPSLRRWLDGNIGSPFPGWLPLAVGPAVLIVLILERRLLGRAIADALAALPRPRAAAWEFVRLGARLLAVAAVAAAIAGLLDAAGLDPRDGLFGPYSQRNTLIVGLIMGFAVIPIIYTISEDAMSSVPSSLRSASLGSGATRWQTATRIVLPVAASGVFSAVMIGLGRAVGETMIVVMATGNTASMDWNIFSGFRTLSANIAVELPEAARGSTHYRVLFLCGLVLFAFTFLINTTAELVRQHFRRRNAAL